jgi:hypothetical protein
MVLPTVQVSSPSRWLDFPMSRTSAVVLMALGDMMLRYGFVYNSNMFVKSRASTRLGT